MTALPSAAPAPSPTLDHLALLRVGGPDATTFLDAQLTRNVPAPAETGVAGMAGYCSPKGRLLATFVVWADPDGVSLVVSRDIAEAIAKRLRMYVLRTKATIVDASATHEIVGAADGAGGAPWSVMRHGDRTDVRFPDVDGRGRVLRVQPASADAVAGGMTDHGADDGAGAGSPIDAAAWRWADIRCGLPRVTALTQDRFVPQMLNLEALGGVDFRKGCFPGQEVVARSQYLGKLKRRTALATIDRASAPAAGTDVWQVGGSEPCGVVVDAERGPDGRVAMLIEIPLALAGADDLRVGDIDGPVATIAPLPYALPDNEVFVRPKL